MAYLAVFLVALTVTFLFTPVVRRLALERGAIVAPDERDIHERPTPTLGGAAMLAGVLVAMVLASQMGAFEDIFAVRTETCLLYTSPSPRDQRGSRMPSSA